MNTTNTSTALKRRLLRRVYYAFVIHMATRPVVRYGLPLMLLAYVVAKLVFVAAVFANARAVGIENFHTFAYTAITHADILTLIITLLFSVMTLLMARDAARIVATKQRQFT
jgi:tetrahydromethanopterin S-methyltransferase subunit D